MTEDERKEAIEILAKFYLKHHAKEPVVWEEIEDKDKEKAFINPVVSGLRLLDKRFGPISGPLVHWDYGPGEWDKLSDEDRAIFRNVAQAIREMIDSEVEAYNQWEVEQNARLRKLKEE